MGIAVERADPAVKRQQPQEQQRVQQQAKVEERKLDAKKKEARDSVERTKDPAQKAPAIGAIVPVGSVPAATFQQTDFSASTGGKNRPPVRKVDPIRAADVGGRRPDQPASTPERATSEAVPEDFSAKGGNFLMTYTGSDHQAHFIKRMGEVGRKEGFGVVAAANTRENADKLKRELGPNATNVRVMNSAGYPWPEDGAHTKKDGSVTVNPTLADPKVTDQLRGRLGQIEPGVDHSQLSHNDVVQKLRSHNATYGLNGMAGQQLRDGQGNPLRTGTEQSADTYSALGKKVNTGTTYTEGGNVIHTTRDGEVHAIVGNESVRHNELLTGMKGDELKAAMAKDLGVKPENMHVVRQPGEFHLDMAMAPWGEGRVLLNDSKMAAEAQIKAQGLARDSDKAKTLLKEADARSRYEQQTKKDLEAAGFKVVPVAGRFFDGHHTLSDGSKGEPREIANFLNGEAGQNPNGGKYFITQRGTPALENAFRSGLPTDIPVRVYFAFDQAATRASLDESAGANCLIKRFY